MEGESRAYLKPVSQNMSGMQGLNLMHAVLKVHNAPVLSHRQGFQPSEAAQQVAQL